MRWRTVRRPRPSYPFPLICSLLSGLKRSLTVSTVPVARSISETREKCDGFRSLSYDRFCFLYMVGSHDPRGGSEHDKCGADEHVGLHKIHI